MMSDSERAGGDELLAIPRLAERVGVTPRVLRYWEEQGLISPTREHGKLRYSPRDVAIAALIRKLLEAGAGVEGVRMLKRLAERDIRRSSGAGDETALVQDLQGRLDQRCFVPCAGTAPDIALGQAFEHPDALDTGSGCQQPADQPGDGHIARRVTQLAVLPGRADQSLFFPVAQHPRGNPDTLGQAGDRHQLVTPRPLRI